MTDSRGDISEVNALHFPTEVGKAGKGDSTWKSYFTNRKYKLTPFIWSSHLESDDILVFPYTTQVPYL